MTAPAASRPVSPTTGDLLRRLRFPLALAALILIAGTVAVLFQPHPGRGFLDPDDPGPTGSRALAQILAQRGERVIRVSTVQQAAREASGGSTLVVTSPAFLGQGQLAALGRLPGDRFLVEPNAPALRELAPGIVPSGVVPVAARLPRCGLGAARLAGDADMGGVTLRATYPAGQQCYPASRGPSLIRFQSAGRTVTVLGTGAPLTNTGLADRGDAALTLNLLASKPVVVWLMPGTAVVGTTGHTAFTDLVPLAAYLVVIQLAVAVAVTAVWRARRLGPLVTEPLPVVVRAAETVEGHGRLYRSRHARDRASDVLRSAAIQRLSPRLGLAPGAEPATIAAAVAARTGRDTAQVGAALFGPAPSSDAALVQLAGTLDTLESEVHET